MRSSALVRPAIATAAALLLISCDSHALFGPSEMVSSSEAAALATYFPPSEISGGWRKRTNPERIREMGLDPDRLNELGESLMSQPYENYKTGVSGYDPSNKVAIMVKKGWIVGEYYNHVRRGHRALRGV